MTGSVLRPRHEASHAAFTEVGGAEVVRHFGDPEAEYAAIRGSIGVVDRGDLVQITMAGRDPIRMLNGLISNDLAGVSRERAVYGVALNPKGRIISELRVLLTGREGEPELLIDLPVAASGELREHLKKYVPPRFARWGESPTQVIGVYGPLAREVVAEALGNPPLPEEDRVTAALDGRTLAVATGIAGGEEGYDLFVAGDARFSLWDTLLEHAARRGGRPAGFEALETLRIEAGRPRQGAELTGETLPAEAFEAAGLMSRAVSFTKGCYTGQEVVVRIAHRGHVNRHLRGVLLGTGAGVEAGTPLVHADSEKQVGWITSVAHSPRLGQRIALAFVRRELVPGDTVRAGNTSNATVSDLPFGTPTPLDGE